MARARKARKGGARPGSGRKRKPGRKKATSPMRPKSPKKPSTAIKGSFVKKQAGSGRIKARFKISGRKVDVGGDVLGRVTSPRGRISHQLTGVPHFAAAPHPQFALSPSGELMAPQDIFLSSTAIEYYAYNRKKRIVEVGFTNGYVYHLFNFTPESWSAWQKAGSKGRHFALVIRPHYKGVWTGPKGSMKYRPGRNYERLK